MKRTIKLTEEDIKKLVKRVMNEGLLVTENPKSIANRINMEQTKSVTCYVKGDTIVFKFKNQEIGLDCTAPDNQ